MLGQDDRHPRVIDYQLMGKQAHLPVIFYMGEVWLTQKQISELFKISVATVNEHLKNILAGREYPAREYAHSFRVKAEDGKQYEIMHYRLEVVEEIERRRRRVKPYLD